MNDDLDKAIDRILAAEDELIPSSAFAASVMARVREEAAAPPPIPFPWKRALPGMVLAGAALGWGVVELVRLTISGALSAPTVSLRISASVMRPMEGMGWAALALALSLMSWVVSRRMIGDSRLL